MRLWLLLCAYLLMLSVQPAVAQTGVIFDDRAPDRIRISNGYYEIVLSKTNGAILALIDRATNASLTLGSRGGCLWGAVFPGHAPDYVGGCSFSSTGGNRFSYSWNSATSRLILSYEGDAGQPHRVNAVVTLQATADAYFDLQITLHNQFGAILQNVLLPSDLSFYDHVTRRAYVPFNLPGVVLKTSFFTDNRSYIPTYPSDAAFADVLVLEVAGGRLAFYTVNPPPSPVQPVAIGFHDDDSQTPGTYFSYHSFHVWVPSGGTWRSPNVRVWIGRTPAQVMLAYRRDNGIDAFPTVAQKAGPKWEALRRAPLIKKDVLRPFADLQLQLGRLPVPSLLHPVGFQPGGHDENYPDFLPPDPQWGSTFDFRTLVTAAQSRGLLVMPYINPTWWDDQSPTLRNLPPSVSVADVAALDERRVPVYEIYGGRGGYVMSPHAPFVQQRLAALMLQWQSDVPVDCVFEDQIGARVWRRDFNANAPNPLSYSDGWLVHVSQYAGQCLMTEMGWDRLAERMIGFHGSLLTWEREFASADLNFGSGNWQPYPLSLWLWHDKVLHYQHDLSTYTMTEDKSVLTWNMAFGMMLSYNWQWDDNDPLGNPWLNLVTQLQQKVAARYAGQPLTSYSELSSDASEVRFGDLTIVANWHPTVSYARDGHRISPSGFYARTDDGSLLAGVFTGLFNDSWMSAGDHYLIIERLGDRIIVQHPIGYDTVLAVRLPESLSSQALRIRAVSAQGGTIGEVGYWVEQNRAKFVYRSMLNGQAVSAYWIEPRTTHATHRFLPMTLRERANP